MSEQPPRYDEELPPPLYENTQPTPVEAPVPQPRLSRTSQAPVWGKDVELIEGRCARQPDASVRVICPACNQVTDTRVKGPPLPKEPLHPPPPPPKSTFGCFDVVFILTCDVLMLALCVATCGASCCCLNPNTITVRDSEISTPAPPRRPQPRGGPWKNSYTHWCLCCGVRLGSYRRENEHIEDCPYIKTINPPGAGIETPLNRAYSANVNGSSRWTQFIEFNFRRSSVEWEFSSCEYFCQGASGTRAYSLSICWPHLRCAGTHSVAATPDISLYLVDEGNRTRVGSGFYRRGDKDFGADVRMDRLGQQCIKLKPAGSSFCAEYALWRLSAGGWVWWKWNTKGTSMHLTDAYDEVCAKLTDEYGDLKFELRTEVVHDTARLEEIIMHGITQIAVQQSKRRLEDIIMYGVTQIVVQRDQDRYTSCSRNTATTPAPLMLSQMRLQGMMV